jgi:uncharacterized glyoxalase superfamily protein PhnB
MALPSKPSNPRLERTGRETVHHGRAAHAGGRLNRRMRVSCICPEHHSDCSPGAVIRIEADGLDAFHAELGAKHKYARPGIEDMPWGTRDMSVEDPFGNRLTFTTGIST